MRYVGQVQTGKFSSAMVLLFELGGHPPAVAVLSLLLGELFCWESSKHIKQASSSFNETQDPLKGTLGALRGTLGIWLFLTGCEGCLSEEVPVRVTSHDFHTKHSGFLGCGGLGGFRDGGSEVGVLRAPKRVCSR